MLEEHLRRMYEVNHGILNGGYGVNQGLELLRRIKAVNGTQQANATFMNRIIYVNVQVVALQ